MNLNYSDNNFLPSFPKDICRSLNSNSWYDSVMLIFPWSFLGSLLLETVFISWIS